MEERLEEDGVRVRETVQPPRAEKKVIFDKVVTAGLGKGADENFLQERGTRMIFYLSVVHVDF